MLRLSKKTWLALEAVVDVAINARPDPVQSKEITKRQGIPQRYLEQVMQQLVHAGILKGVRGPRGGYTLARERRRIAVGEVVRVVGAMEASDEPATAQPSELGERVIAPGGHAAACERGGRGARLLLGGRRGCLWIALAHVIDAWVAKLAAPADAVIHRPRVADGWPAVGRT